MDEKLTIIVSTIPLIIILGIIIKSYNFRKKLNKITK